MRDIYDDQSRGVTWRASLGVQRSSVDTMAPVATGE